MSLGFVDRRFNGSFESVFAIDNDAAAVETNNANFAPEKHHAVCENIEDWLVEFDPPIADVVIGGPPCQGFSILNKKRSGDARRARWEPLMDVVELSNSSIFVMENVLGLLKSAEVLDIGLPRLL